MTGHPSLQFLEHLRQSGRLREAASPEAGTADRPADPVQREQQSGSHRKLWEMADLPASEFADEAARFFGHGRVTLQEMLQAAPLVGSFSQRFLRESLVFPYQSSGRGVVLAMADPADLAALRAAEIVL